MKKQDAVIAQFLLNEMGYDSRWDNEDDRDCVSFLWDLGYIDIKQSQSGNFIIERFVYDMVGDVYKRSGVYVSNSVGIAVRKAVLCTVT